MFAKIKKSFKHMLKGSNLPCYVLSKKPPITISYWHDFITNAEAIIATYNPQKPAYHISMLGWERESIERAQEIKDDVEKIEKNHPNLNFIFLCNSMVEEYCIKEVGLRGIFCHQNAFVDENELQIRPLSDSVFDAVYLARITPFKRHYLATKVKSLKLIGDFHDYEEEYFRDTMKELQHADWTQQINYDEVPENLTQGKVGLALSATEGAMFASMEYLLCGRPVVSTKCKGGREAMFDEQCATIVEDDPEMVAEAVEKLVEKNLSPEFVRETTIEKMGPHRKVFKKIIQTIYDETNTKRNFENEWDKVYYNKFGLRCPMPLNMKWFRILKTYSKLG